VIAAAAAAAAAAGITSRHGVTAVSSTLNHQQTGEASASGALRPTGRVR